MSTQTAAGFHYPEWSFGDRLRKIRREAHLTQVKFAAQLGVNADTYAAWESDRNEPVQSQAAGIAKRIELLLHVPAAWTLGAYDEDPRPGVSQNGGQRVVRHQGLEPRTRWLMSVPPIEHGAVVLDLDAHRRPEAA